MEKWNELLREAIENAVKKDDFRILLSNAEEFLAELYEMTIISSNWLHVRIPEDVGYGILLTDDSYEYEIIGDLADPTQFEFFMRQGKNEKEDVWKLSDVERNVFCDLMNSFDVLAMVNEMDGHDIRHLPQT